MTQAESDHPHDYAISAGAPPGPGFEDIVRRIVTAYRAAIELPLGASQSMWLTGPLFELRKHAHDRLVGGLPGAAADLLLRPGDSDLLYGFEDNTRTQAARADRPTPLALVRGAREQIRLLAEAVGATRIRQPGTAADIDPTALLDALDAAFGIRIDFPNPWPGEEGLDTGRGVLTYRATQALYQAWRLRQLTSGTPEPRIVEIGAGAGRTALYAWRLGLRHYTIVDLPLTAVASACFLARTLGAENVSLHREEAGPGIRIIPPDAFLRSSETFDVALNADSLTEMARSTAEAYVDAIDARADLFLSINHEGNPFRARDLFADRPHTRAPYLMRAGYVEEVLVTSYGTAERERPLRERDATIADLKQRIAHLSSGRGALDSLRAAVRRRARDQIARLAARR